MTAESSSRESDLSRRSGRVRVLPAGGAARSPEQARQDRRERLIQSLYGQLALGRSTDAITINEVTSIAHVTRPSFYDAFPNGKQGFLLAAHDHAIQELLTATRAGCATVEADPDSRVNEQSIRAGVSALVDWLVDNPGAGRLITVEATQVLGGFLALYDTIDRTFVPLFKPPDQGTHERVRVVLAGVHHLLYMRFINDEQASLTHEIDAVTQIIINFTNITQPPNPGDRHTKLESP